MDLSVRVTDLAPDRVPVVVQSAATLKAGALMEFAASLGAGAAGGDRGKVEALGRFGRRLGVALQMFDDVSGITDPRRRDKGCEDLRLARLSWVWSWLAQTTDAATYERYRHEATEVAGGAPPGPLAAALRARMNGAREEIGRQLLAALDEVRPHVGDARHLDTLRAELDRLEQSYV